MIRAVLWDVDGTLLDFLAAERAAIRRCFEIFRLGECTDAMLEDYSAINVRWWERLERGEYTKPEILVGRFREFFAKYGLDLSAAEPFNEEYQVRLGDTIVFFPGALETLHALKGRVLQCAVTNGTKTAQRRKLSLSGMDKIFDRVFISDDLGVEKPSAAFFEKVFAGIGPIPPREVLIVGDSLTSDIRGGLNAGIRTCWYNPWDRENTDRLPIDYMIASLSEVPALIDAEK